MILPIIGIRLKSKNFVPLINTDGKARKIIEVYKEDFINREIPIYVCKMQNEKKVEKVYKIGQITVRDDYFINVKENPNDNSADKLSLFIESKLEDEKNLEIEVSAQNSEKRIPLKRYTADIINELEVQVAEEREGLLLDYGNFIKCKKQSGFLLPELDLTEDGQVLKESSEEPSIEISENSKEVEQNDKKNTKKEKARLRTRSSLTGKISGAFLFFAIISFCLIIAGTGYLLYRDACSKIKSECENKTRTASIIVSKKLKSLTKNLVTFNSLYEKSHNKGEVINTLFKNNSDIGLICLPGDKQIINDSFVSQTGVKVENLASVLSYFTSEIKQAENGKMLLKNASYIAKIKSAVLFIPILNNKTNCYEVMSVVFATEDFETICEESDDFGTILCDVQSNLIAGISYEWVMQNHNICEFKNKISTYSEITEYACYVSTYAKIAGYNKYLIETLVKMAYIAAIVLFVIVIFVSMFAKSIVKPINKMRLAIDGAMNEGADVKLKTHRRDELGALIKSFSDFAEKYAGRGAYRNVSGYSKTNDMLENSKNGNINLKGETKITTVLITQIKDFNKITDSLTATEVIKLLNDYIYEMEKCINATGGYINKVNGNTIFATWGAPSSSGTPKSDAINAIKTAFRMKYALVDFNSDRGNYNTPVLKIGFGLHTGAIASGQICTKDVTEYACVGSAVNTAGEIENYTSSFGCDILISEDTYLLVNDIVEAQKISGVAIKGQKDAVNLYAVSSLKK